MCTLLQIKGDLRQRSVKAAARSDDFLHFDVAQRVETLKALHAHHHGLQVVTILQHISTPGMSSVTSRVMYMQSPDGVFQMGCVFDGRQEFQHFHVALLLLRLFRNGCAAFHLFQC